MYDDLMMDWVQECERGMLELAYMDLLRSYRELKRKHEKYVSDTGWERTMRRQERSGGWM